MKNYLAFIILSLFAVSCHQDDDAEFLQEATLKGQNDAHFENREAVENTFNYSEPDMDVQNGDDPPPKQIGGNGAKPAPTNDNSIGR